MEAEEISQDSQSSGPRANQQQLFKENWTAKAAKYRPVSYTHLTLPTKA